MGIGYVIGCLFSILFWKLDRTKIIHIINALIKKIIRNDVILQFVYLILLLALIVVVKGIANNEIYNFVTAFIVIDVSNTERRNLSLRERTHFYDSISLISRSLVCGFIAPLLIILLFGNYFAIFYTLLYNLSVVDSFTIIKLLFNILSIIPSIVTQVMLYLVYLFRNKKILIDFKGDYLVNNFTRPLLNIDILGAYIESVNFYYYYNSKDMHYIKSYGGYTNKIDDVCVKDYLSISYGICMLFFILFFIVLRFV